MQEGKRQNGFSFAEVFVMASIFGLMFLVAVIAILVALVLAVIRAILGPSVFDRMLAGNAIGTLAILLLAAVGF